MKKIITSITFLFLCFGATHAFAEELAFAASNYSGTIAGKPVLARLTMIGDFANGYYCYQPCKSPQELSLAGEKNNDNWLFAENVQTGKNEENSDHWRVNIVQGKVTGNWISSDEQKIYPIELTALGKKFPYDIYIVADRELPEPDLYNSDCNAISAIKLKHNDKVVQTLQGPFDFCPSFALRLEDLNFDGFLDIGLVLDTQVNNSPYAIWLYDQKSRRFKEAEGVTNLEIDALHKRIYSAWQGGATFGGVNVYEWRGYKLHRIAHAQSYAKLLKQGAETRYCYTWPGYSKKRGRIFWQTELISDCKKAPF